MKINEKFLESEDLRLMQYRGSNVIGTVNQIYAFCCNGIKSGEDKDRLQKILDDLCLGKMIVADDSSGVMVDIAERWDEWVRR